MTTTWHIDERILAAYADGTLDGAAAWSVEAHLPGCERCRRNATDLVDAGRLRGIRDAVIDHADRPRPGPIERLLVRCGVAEHTARLLVATPALRTSWLLAVVTVLGAAVAAAHLADGEHRTWMFLAVAPLLPVAGVAAAYGPRTDPTYEISMAAPMSGFRLLLLRVTAVQAVTVAIALVASLALPELALAAGWLLPALALALVSLALSAQVGPVTASAIAAAGWIGFVVGTRPGTAVSEANPFTATGQIGCAVIAIVAAVVLALYRRKFDVVAGRPARHLFIGGRTQ